VTGPAPRPPLAVDLRDVHAGSPLAIERVVPAPGDLGVALAGVPEGSDLGLHVEVQQVADGVLVRGTVSVQVRAECARCLDPITWDEEVDVTEFFRDPAALEAEGVDPSETEDLVLEADVIDLEPIVRDAVVLRLPLAPVCSPDCPGLCPTCGVHLADDPAHHHEDVDPRWAALVELLEDDREPPR
jgi:uncharacterized protein